MTDRRAVCVFASSGVRPGQPEYAAAEQVGRTLGSLGYAVATGGYGGAMEAVSRGASAARADVIGVTCRVWTMRPNRFVERVIQTPDIYQRLRTLIELGTAGHVVLPGATGTLLELAAVWELAGKPMPAPRPIVCVGEFWRPLVELIRRYRPSAASPVSFVDAPAQLAGHFPAL